MNVNLDNLFAILGLKEYELSEVKSQLVQAHNKIKELEKDKNTSPDNPVVGIPTPIKHLKVQE